MALQFPEPAPAPGLDVALVRLQDSGAFDLQFSGAGVNKGNPVLDQTRTHAMLSTLVSWKRGTRPQSQVEEGGYYWDETGLRGTLIWTVTQDKRATRSDLVAYAEDGGKQLRDLSYITAFEADANRRSQANYQVTVKWATPSGTWQTNLTF